MGLPTSGQVLHTHSIILRHECTSPLTIFPWIFQPELRWDNLFCCGQFQETQNVKKLYKISSACFWNSSYVKTPIYTKRETPYQRNQSHSRLQVCVLHAARQLMPFLLKDLLLTSPFTITELQVRPLLPCCSSNQEWRGGGSLCHWFKKCITCIVGHGVLFTDCLPAVSRVCRLPWLHDCFAPAIGAALTNDRPRTRFWLLVHLHYIYMFCT